MGDELERLRGGRVFNHRDALHAKPPFPLLCDLMAPAGKTPYLML